MTFAARRFPDTITRIREAPGGRNDFGEWQAGQSEEFELKASVQPLKLMDSELTGGDQLIHRLKCFVLPRRERISIARATLTLYGEPLTLYGDALTWGANFTFLDEHALAAAFEAAGADKVRLNGALYVVESSRLWPRYTSAVLLRET